MNKLPEACVLYDCDAAWTGLLNKYFEFDPNSFNKPLLQMIYIFFLSKTSKFQSN